ncbi:MAG: hypothetical protein AYK19_17680 [Theionarchaea archaeon DG-70-1]|nr:MAG: hypothetical protein AYK19_17680 [Theionarchaea archaeon DG-70-1]
MKIQYKPSSDELFFINRPVIGSPNKEVGHFKLWWDDEGTICALAITDYTGESEEFRKNLHIVQLGGIWKGTTISDEDIRETRKELLKILEEKW